MPDCRKRSTPRAAESRPADGGANMDIAPIKTQRDYRRVLMEIDGVMAAKRDTPDGDRLNVLVALVEAWERKRHPIERSDG